MHTSKVQEEEEDELILAHPFVGPGMRTTKTRENKYYSHAPFCPSCGCIMPREGVYCQLCRIKYGYEYDECICYSDAPESCTSKLEHECCCDLAFNALSCRAVKHDCICGKNAGSSEDCRSCV